MKRAFLRKLLTGFSKVIGQKVDKKTETGALLTHTETQNADNRKVVVYRTQREVL
jgi:hypothetical protein